MGFVFWLVGIHTYVAMFLIVTMHRYYASHGSQSIIPIMADALACYMQKVPHFTELPSTNLKNSKTTYFYMFGDVFLIMALLC